MKKIVKHKRINYICFSTILICILILLSSCNLFFNDSNITFEEPETEVPDGMCSIKISTGLVSRSAFPDALPDDIKYYATISYNNNGTKYLGLSQTNLVTKEYLKDTEDSNVCFVFASPEYQGTYTITVYACANDNPETSCIAKGSTNIYLNKGQRGVIGTTNVSLKNSANTGKGSFELKYSVSAITDAQYFKMTITNSSGEEIVIDSSSPSFFTIESNKITFKKDNMDSGTYTFTLSIENSAHTIIPIENPIQIVNILPYMLTNTWFESDGSSSELIVIKKAKRTTCYVCGTSDRKVYGDEITNYKTPSDTGNDGSLFEPFASVKKAVDFISSQDFYTSEDCTIYIDGLCKAPSPPENLDDNDGYISINPNCTLSKENNLTIKALEGTATIDANIAEGKTGRVLYLRKNGNNHSKVTIENVIIKGGRAESDGGGIVILSMCKLILKGSTSIENNYANEKGGGIFVQGTLELEDSETKIQNNTSVENGGGIYIDNGIVNIKNGSIKKNKITGTDVSINGSAVYVSKGTFTFSDGSITENINTENSYAVYIANSDAVFNINGNASIYNNGNSKGTCGSFSIKESAYISDDVFLSSNAFITLKGDLIPPTGKEFSVEKIVVSDDFSFGSTIVKPIDEKNIIGMDNNLYKFGNIVNEDYTIVRSPFSSTKGHGVLARAIKNSANLKAFLENPSSDNYWGLTNDITLTIKPDDYESNSTNNVFDGRGHTITYNADLRYKSDGYELSSVLFYENNGYIQNLTIARTTDPFTTNNTYKYGSFAYRNTGTIANCVNKISISSPLYSGGGIVNENVGDTSNNTRGRISACVNLGNFKNEIDFNNLLNAFPDSYFGGIAAKNNNGKIFICINYGTIYIDATVDNLSSRDSFGRLGALVGCDIGESCSIRYGFFKNDCLKKRFSNDNSYLCYIDHNNEFQIKRVGDTYFGNTIMSIQHTEGHFECHSNGNTNKENYKPCGYFKDGEIEWDNYAFKYVTEIGWVERREVEGDYPSSLKDSLNNDINYRKLYNYWYFEEVDGYLLPSSSAKN